MGFLVPIPFHKRHKAYIRYAADKCYLRVLKILFDGTVGARTCLKEIVEEDVEECLANVDKEALQFEECLLHVILLHSFEFMLI